LKEGIKPSFFNVNSTSCDAREGSNGIENRYSGSRDTTRSINNAFCNSIKRLYKSYRKEAQIKTQKCVYAAAQRIEWTNPWSGTSIPDINMGPGGMFAPA
jgi:hypothetical protein